MPLLHALGPGLAPKTPRQALIGLVLLTGVGNRVLYKMALVPLRDHIFFLAQLQNLGYLAVYFTALAWRRR